MRASFSANAVADEAPVDAEAGIIQPDKNGAISDSKTALLRRFFRRYFLSIREILNRSKCRYLAHQ